MLITEIINVKRFVNTRNLYEMSRKHRRESSQNGGLQSYASSEDSSPAATDYAPYTESWQTTSRDENEEENEIYIVRQEQGYFSILFSLVQTIILALMMWQCGIAPMNLK